MAPISSCVAFILAVACLLAGVFGTHYPEIIYLEEHCNSPGAYSVTADVRIKLSKSYYLGLTGNCTIILSATPGTKLVAQFLDYRMNSAYTNELANCHVESIQLYDWAGTAHLQSRDNGYCSYWRPTSQYRLGAGCRFDYITYYQNDLIIAATVDLLVTEIVDKRAFLKSECPTGYFDCYYNNYCVRETVKCNGYDDCGNNRDEIAECGLPAFDIFRIVFNSIALLLLFCVLVFVIWYSIKR